MKVRLPPFAERVVVVQGKVAERRLLAAPLLPVPVVVVGRALIAAAAAALGAMRGAEVTEGLERPAQVGLAVEAEAEVGGTLPTTAGQVVEVLGFLGKALAEPEALIQAPAVTAAVAVPAALMGQMAGQPCRNQMAQVAHMAAVLGLPTLALAAPAQAALSA